MVGLSHWRDGVWENGLRVEVDRRPSSSVVSVANSTEDTDYQCEKTERQTDS